MRASKLCVFLGLVVTIALLNGCAYSLQPLYHPDENVREPGLVGTWTTKDGQSDNNITIQANADGTYEVTGTDSGSLVEQRYKVRLVRLGSNLFADAIFDNQSLNDKKLDLPGGVVPLHLFYKISLSGDTLQTAQLNHDWLVRQFDAKKISIAHQSMGDDPDSDILFTASTGELRRFIQQIADTPGAFHKPDVAYRQKQAGAEVE
ncbi:MAG TPA: hypothetical protein VMV59_05985 [Candidatus Dormibacteraeota bacterium]|nr:hypothetical protein [Candidatus Dormibacteraeota bacterium]